MSGTDVRARKKFKILYDVDKRQRDLEDHAVQLILQKTNPHAPMIPMVESARVRQLCGWCSDPHWSPEGTWLCPKCEADQQHEIELNRELNRVQRDVRHAELEAKRQRLEELKERGASPAEILAALGAPAPMMEDLGF